MSFFIFAQDPRSVSAEGSKEGRTFPLILEAGHASDVCDAAEASKSALVLRDICGLLKSVNSSSVSCCDQYGKINAEVSSFLKDNVSGMGVTARFFVVPVPQLLPPQYAICSLLNGTNMYVSLKGAEESSSVFSETLGPNETFEFQFNDHSYTQKSFFNKTHQLYLCVHAAADGSVVVSGRPEFDASTCIFNVETLVGTGPVIPGLEYTLTSVFGGKVLTVEEDETVSVQELNPVDGRPTASQRVVFEAITSDPPYLYRMVVFVPSKNEDEPTTSAVERRYVNIDPMNHTITLQKDAVAIGHDFQVVAEPLVPLRCQLISVSGRRALRVVPPVTLRERQHKLGNTSYVVDSSVLPVEAGERYVEDLCGFFEVVPYVPEALKAAPTEAATKGNNSYAAHFMQAVQKAAIDEENAQLKHKKAVDEHLAKKSKAEPEQKEKKLYSALEVEQDEGSDVAAPQRSLWRIGASVGGLVAGGLMMGAQYMAQSQQ